MDNPELLAKKQEMAEVVINAAIHVVNSVREMPQTGKHKRNIFIKTYNRRPRNKQKRAMAFANIAIHMAISRQQLLRINSQPIAKYLEGENILPPRLPSFSFPVSNEIEQRLKAFNGGRIFAVQNDNSIFDITDIASIVMPESNALADNYKLNITYKTAITK